MYYKIVSKYSFFTELCYDMDISNIPPGTIFSAPPHSKHKPRDSNCLINESCLHFSDGAFDTMLWLSRLSYTSEDNCQIYAIQPLSNIVKARCPDNLGIYQCGAQKIQFLQKQNIDEMYERAIQEFDFNKYENFAISLNLWRKHQLGLFCLYEIYHK